MGSTLIGLLINKVEFGLYFCLATNLTHYQKEIEIIGEAMSRILKLNPNIQIKNARKIVDTRNWVIHGYDKVDDVLIWGIISKISA